MRHRGHMGIIFPYSILTISKSSSGVRKNSATAAAAATAVAGSSMSRPPDLSILVVLADSPHTTTGELE